MSLSSALKEECNCMDILGDPIPSAPSGFAFGGLPLVQILLGPACWHEPRLARIVSREKEILLSPRENALLTLLLSAPYQWHKTNDLATLLCNRIGTAEVSLQSIRQTILGLRRKLDKSSAFPDLLQCRPGHGYGIFPPNSTNPLS